MQAIMMDKRKFPIRCRDTKEVCHNYQEYLSSKHWQTFRQTYLTSRRTEYKVMNHLIKRDECACCTRRDLELHIHHITYQHLGNETFRDVIRVCSDCHQRIHTRIELGRKKGFAAAKMNSLMKGKSWAKIKRQQMKKLREGKLSIPVNVLDEFR